jgi:hypothetical protein
VLAYGGDVFAQALDLVPGIRLFFEMLDPIGVGVCGMSFA